MGSNACKTVLVVAAAAAVVGPGCHHSPPRSTLPIPERLAEVQLIGVHAFEGDDLRRGLSTPRLIQSGDPFDPRQVTLDEQRLRSHYLRHGFFAVQIRTTTELGKQGVIVGFHIDEGDRARFGQIDIDGLPGGDRDHDLAADHVRGELAFRKGDRFDYDLYEQGSRDLDKLIEEAGYAHVDITGTVAADAIHNTADVRYQVDAGPLVRFGEISLTGIDPDLRQAALDRVEIHPGGLYDPKAVTDTQTALYGLGRFANVRIELAKEGRPAVLPVQITVVMAPRHEIRLGGGVGADPAQYEVRGRAAYAVLGWSTTLTNTRAELRPSVGVLRDASRDRVYGIEATGTIERLDLFRSHIRGEARAAYELIPYEAYSVLGPRFRLGIDSPLGDHIKGGAGWQIRRQDFVSIDELLDDSTTRQRLGLNGITWLGYFDQALSLDLRDDPFDPHLGAFAELRAEEGTVAAGGSFDYVKVTPELRGYVGRSWAVLAARVRVGAMWGDRPATQRYFSGGASSQRGFPERRLAPTITGTRADGSVDAVTIGGGGLVETSTELRVPLGRLFRLRWIGTVFLDGADVQEELAQIDLGNLHWAVGGGLGAATPIGPVRIDLGYRITRYGEGEIRAGERLVGHLGLGYAY